jgi:N-acyl-D-amino-acid deacylase
MRFSRLLIWLPVVATLFSACNSQKYDLIIRNGMIYDGTGEKPYQGDIAVNGDTIMAVGKFKGRGKEEIDAKGMAISPGFVNMLSWASESMLVDGRAMSDIKQGVTLEVMGEGWSMGPYNDQMLKEEKESQGDLKYDIKWRTLGGYLSYLEEKGVAPNVASFVGATTLRVHEVGYADRQPTPQELYKMEALARQAMEEGALGLSSAMIYAPATYATTDELIALARIAAQYGGMYITHMRSEGNLLLEGVDEVVQIASEARISSQIYHLKAAGKNNWGKIDKVIAKLDSAQKAGINISTNMYTYTAGATGLDAAMPTWCQEGGFNKWVERLKDPATRQRIVAEMKTDARTWENLYYAAGSPDKVILVSFRNDALKKYTGKTLAEVAKLRGKSPEETACDLVIEDGSRVGTVYFLMSEDNIKKQIKLPYMTFGSDAGAPATEGVFLKSNTHPRAYGNVARLLGKYVRDEKIIPLEEAIRKLTAQACENLKIGGRGLLIPGFFADIVVFDPKTIKDNATYDQPHQYATGVQHVFVNGVQVLKDGEATGKFGGRFVKGPGAKLLTDKTIQEMKKKEKEGASAEKK